MDQYKISKKPTIVKSIILEKSESIGIFLKKNDYHDKKDFRCLAIHTEWSSVSNGTHLSSLSREKYDPGYKDKFPEDREKCW